MKARKIAGFLIAACMVTGILWAMKVPSKGKVTCSALNVRTGPGTGYSVVGVISGGDVVQILDVSGGWYLVNTGSYQGRYVYAGYIDVTDYGEINDEDASKKPYSTLLSTDPTRPEAAPPRADPPPLGN
ncbi:hypothetical protein AUK22_06345 [bacterium CG2_30_54_10]|nr:MAG: hypothetical protein AUK22_06345 [bacterium CG2_30_54_10]